MELFEIRGSAEAEEARDAGLYRVERTDRMRLCWIDRALSLLGKCRLKEATGEEIRLWLETRIGSPHHHNAAGAMIRRAIDGGMLEATGRTARMKTRKSHARRTPLYLIIRGKRNQERARKRRQRALRKAWMERRNARAVPAPHTNQPENDA